MNEGLSWTERAAKIVRYHSKALDFVMRASEQLPTFPEDAHSVSRLWVEAENLDGIICGLLDEINSALLSGKAEMDTTRGASMKQGMMDDQYVSYECTWSLFWEDLGVFISLAVDPRSRSYEANVHSFKSRETQTIGFPLKDTELKEALTYAYVAEATLHQNDHLDLKFNRE